MTFAYLSVELRDNGRFFLNADAFGFSQERIAHLLTGKDEAALKETNASLHAAAFRLGHTETVGSA